MKRTPKVLDGGSLIAPPFYNRPAFNRRAFLRGAGSIAIGLPFLEGLPERSAWAADAVPVFSLFIVGACGVVGNKFFPNTTGALTTSGLASMTDKAVSVLAPHAANLLFVKGINFPLGGPTGCGHAQGLCQTLTAAAPGGTGASTYSNGISADMVIAWMSLIWRIPRKATGQWMNPAHNRYSLRSTPAVSVRRNSSPGWVGSVPQTLSP